MIRSKAFVGVLVLALCHLAFSMEESSFPSIGTFIAITNLSKGTNLTNSSSEAVSLMGNQNIGIGFSETTDENVSKDDEFALDSNITSPEVELGNTTWLCWNSTDVTGIHGNDTDMPCDDNVSENTTVTIVDAGEEGKSTDKSDYVGYVVVPTFFLLAVFGNSLTIRVMVSRKFRAKTSSIILIALSVSDTIFSCIVPFNKKFIRNMLGYDIRALSNIGCSIFFIIHKTSKMSSSWFVVFISFERFMAICFPLKTKFICTKRNTLIGIACVYIGLFIFNGIWDFSTKIVNGVCIPNYAVPELVTLAKVYLVLGTFVYCLLPAAIMLVLTPITVFQLVRHSSVRKTLSKKDTRSDETARMTAMLIGVTISFFILVTPIGITHNVSYALGENIFETKHVGMVIARETLQTMEQLNYSINFLLYVMCSRDFRKKVAKILGLKALKKHARSMFSSGTTKNTQSGTNVTNTSQRRYS